MLQEQESECTNCGWVPAPGDLWPSYGGLAVRWIEDNLIFPEGDTVGEPFRLRPDQKKYIWKWYEACPDCNYWRYTEGVRGASTGDGKALSVTTPIPTVSGWVTMGDLRVGDQVFDDQGQPARVVHKSQVRLGDTYNVRFSDHEVITADAEHLWTVEEITPRGNHKILTATTAELITRGVKDGSRCRYRVPMTAPLNLPEQEVSADPYVLGVWLGDGAASSACVTVGVEDWAEISPHISLAGYVISSQGLQSGGSCSRAYVKGLSPHLRSHGVLNNKHIPPIYLRASEKQRLALLQGLMDTDGYCGDRGRCDFVTTSLELRDGVMELLSTFGIQSFTRMQKGRPYSGVPNGKEYKDIHHVQFRPQGLDVFRLERKLKILHEGRTFSTRSKYRQIVSIEPTTPVPMQCIQVDSPSHLYLAGRKMVQTHNSTFIAAISLVEFAGPPEIAPISPNIVVAAASWDQADELFRKAGQMVGGRGDEITEAPLCGFFNVTDSKITFKGGATGVLERVAAVAGTNEGGLPTLFVCDELHEWGDVGSNKARIYTVIGKSTRKRKTRHGPGRVLNLSTAGFDKDHSLLGAMYMHGKAVLDDPSLDPKLLFDWQEADEHLDLEDPLQRAEAVRQASKAADVLWDVRDRVNDWGKPMFPKHEWIRYYANRWVDIAEDSWLVDYPAAWGKCKGTWEHDPLNPFVLSVDMALKHDHVAVARCEELPHRQIPGIDPHVFKEGRCTTPGCKQRGPIAVTVKHWHANDSGQIDHLEVWGYIDGLAKGKNFRGVVYDPRFFELPARVLEQKNVLTVQFDQSPQRMAPAAGLTRQLIVDEQIIHNGDQELESAVKSAASVPQERGGFTLKKGKSLRHIDAAVAMCMGVWALREIIPMPPPATMDINKNPPGDFFRPGARLSL